MNRKPTSKTPTGGTMFRAPSYFVWNHRKHASPSPRPSPRTTAANTNMNNTQDQDGTVGDSGPSPRKMRSPRRRPTSGGVAGADNQSTDTRSSVLSGDSGGLVTISPKHKDPDRIKKDREREERVRQAREKLELERKRKLIDLQEQQRQAQENREKQLEMRRRKIEDLRRRDVERRAEVEKRRRDKENAERPYYCHSLFGSRRETLLMKAEERVARYEAWKRSGQKGGRGHVLGFGSATPRHICLPYERPRRSSSHSALVRRSPNGSESDYSFRPQRRALSACSTVRRHCCVDLNRTAPSAPPPTRPKSVVTLNVSSLSSSSSSSGGVKLRENKSPRKPRPASVGTSMPSFVTLDTPKSSSPRSKSTDRLARERSRPRTSASARRPDEKEKEEKKAGEKSNVKMSRRTLERLSTPRQMAALIGDKEPTSTPRREAVARKSSTREKTPRDSSAKPSPQQPAAAPSPAATAAATDNSATPTESSTRAVVRVVSPTPGADEDGGSNASPARSVTSAAERPSSARSAEAEKASSTPSMTTDKPPSVVEKSSSGDISAEEYKARLAEKRRQAREKAEREAEEERKRQEELARLEEERRRQEEEEQRRQDEEAMRLAEVARKAEEERLQKAIEAEEARRAEEAARLEQEKLAKEEAERKAKEEAERLELEKQEKARREEEERQERKKRLEMIMKRVKTESPAEGAKDGSSKSVTSSPAKSVNSTASSDTSPTEPENKTVQAMAAQSAATNINGQSAAQDMPVVSAASQEGLEVEDRGVKEEEENGSPINAPSPVTTSDQQAAPAGSPEQEKAPDWIEKPGIAGPEGEGAASDQVSSGSSSPVPPAESGPEKPKFKSPLLQKLVEGKDDGSSSAAGGPRFKSPLLQNLLGKTKMRSMGSSQDHSVSDPNLAHAESRTGNGDGNAALVVGGGVMSSSMVDMGTGDSSQKEVMNSSEEKDVDTSEDSSSSPSSPRLVTGKQTVSNGDEDVSIAVSAHSHEDISSVAQPEPMEISTPMESSGAPAIMAASTASCWSQQDSGVVLGSDELRSVAPSGSLQYSFNGHGPARLAQSHGLEDSSISMRSVESVSSSITDSAAGSVFSSVTSLPPGQVLSAGDKDFEELIELPVNNKSSTSATSPPSATLTVLDNSDDLVNFNKLVVEGGSEQTTAVVPPPIIAFEDRRQDVPDLLS